MTVILFLTIIIMSRMLEYMTCIQENFSLVIQNFSNFFLSCQYGKTFKIMLKEGWWGIVILQYDRLSSVFSVTRLSVLYILSML